MRSLLTLLLRDPRVFDAVEQHADCTRQAAGLLCDVLEHFGEAPARVRAIVDLERRGDGIVRRIFTHLHTTLLTPLDRDDIHALATRLDDVLDVIEGAAQALVVYRVPEPTACSLALATVARASVDVMHHAVMCLRSLDPSFERDAGELHRLEHQADQLLHAALVDLFETPARAVDVLRWKDIYEMLEAVTDRCEDVGNTIESIFLKMR